MPASAAALEFKVEFSLKSKQLKTVKWSYSNSMLVCRIYQSYVGVYHTN